MKRGLKWAIAAVVALVVIVVGGWIIYAKVINKPEDELTTDDLNERLEDTTPVATDAPVVTTGDTTAPGVTDPATTDPATTEPVTTDAPSTGVDGEWTVASGSEVGYRVEEKLSGIATTAVGRGTDVTGSITISGTEVTAAEFTVQVATISSDESRRDSQFSGRIMETSEFPEATFTLTSPIDLGSIPEEGAQIAATATGDLTLHGVTKSVTFDLTAQLENGKAGLLGQIPVVFADYDIDNPSFGPIETEDNGLLEILLILQPD